MSERTYRIGIAGCGTIFPAYMEGLARFSHLEVIRCADIIPERALMGHEKYGIPRYGGPDELLADADVEIVLNITPPLTHFEVSSAALEAGKHLYTEKPITTDLGDANRLLDLAEGTELVLGSAPDTFLGSWGATSRAVVDSGALGEIAAATAFIPHNRVETWHPDPGFLFQAGGGPTLDRGPYYIAALVNLLGPIAEVAGVTRIGASTRVVSAPDRLVEEVEVVVPTHSTAVLRFESGVLGTIIFSSDIWATELPHIEVYGSAGTLSLPHPNWFDGPVRFNSGATRETEWQVVPSVAPEGGLRGEGIADMITSLQTGRPQRTGPELARHALEVLLAVERSSDEQGFITIESRCERPVWGDLPAAIVGVAQG